MSDALIRGHVYLVNSSRKGTFVGMLVYADETWATFEITDEREKGEEVTVRRSFCSFTEQPASTAATGAAP